MKREFAKRYQRALLAYLKQKPGSRLHIARGLGERALKAGLQTLDMAKLHEQILVTRVLPGYPARQQARVIKQAGTFFTEAIVPTPKVRRETWDASVPLNQIVEMLSQRTVELAAANLVLKQEITQRKAVEAALKKSERHYSQLLEQSDRLQGQLRQLSRQILLAQEEERKRISRELHDVIAQTLTGINLRLAALKKEANSNSRGLDLKIARTQHLVEKSVNIVHQFARELRPAVLDDLGLVPALHSFLKGFTEQTGVRTYLTAFAGVEQMDTLRRTVLFRVAQEALTNVARHAQASRADVSISRIPNGVCMKIKDDGKSFQLARVSDGKDNQRLGLLGMRERLEMVGGSFEVESAPGKGTTVTAQIPSHGEAMERKHVKSLSRSTAGRTSAIVLKMSRPVHR